MVTKNAKNGCREMQKMTSGDHVKLIQLIIETTTHGAPKLRPARKQTTRPFLRRKLFVAVINVPARTGNDFPHWVLKCFRPGRDSITIRKKCRPPKSASQLYITLTPTRTKIAQPTGPKIDRHADQKLVIILVKKLSNELTKNQTT